VTARLIGVGVGPGDPELVTLKAIRALRSADVVAHFAKIGHAGNGRTTAASHLPPGVAELPLIYPVTTEIPRCEPRYRELLRDFYDAAAASLADRLDAGLVVAVICEGDPMFYGSFMHLHVRLAQKYPTEVVAGVSGMAGCWSAAGMPIAQGDDVFMVLPATLAEPELVRRLTDADAVAIMKIGRHLPKVRRALARARRLERAIYVERGTMHDGVTMRLADKPDDIAPYFATVLVPGWQERR
jgi:precorrin-2/cobalt-factor-2 C20-methyltransferase